MKTNREQIEAFREYLIDSLDVDEREDSLLYEQELREQLRAIGCTDVPWPSTDSGEWRAQ